MNIVFIQKGSGGGSLNTLLRRQYNEYTVERFTARFITLNKLKTNIAGRKQF